MKSEDFIKEPFLIATLPDYLILSRPSTPPTPIPGSGAELKGNFRVTSKFTKFMVGERFL
jgi:hypothetical protein